MVSKKKHKNKRLSASLKHYNVIPAKYFKWLPFLCLLAIGLLVIYLYWGTGKAKVATAAPVLRSDGASLILAPTGGGSVQNPDFAPDGKTLLYTLFSHGYNIGPAALSIVSPEGAPAREILNDQVHDHVNLPGSSWNAATNRIVFASDRSGTDNIWTVTPDGTELFQVTHSPSLEHYIEPSFSPDGQWIVFEADTTDTLGQQKGSTWKVRADGTSLTQLTGQSGNETDDRQPNWSPRGDTIVIQRRMIKDNNWDLYILASDGTNVRRVTTNGGSTDASWSPDGQWIVYSTSDNDFPFPGVFIMPKESGTPLRVTHDPVHGDGAPSWSLDGLWIAFESHVGADETPSSLWRIAAPILATPPTNPTNTPIPPPIPSVTPIHTPTPTPTVVINTPTPNTTKLSFVLKLHGIGSGGDNVNPYSTGNSNPLQIQRVVKLSLFDSNNVALPPRTGFVTFQATTGDFQGVVDLGSSLSGYYTGKVSTPSFLTQTIPGILSLSPGQTTTVLPISLVAGDVNTDDRIDILDYNMIMNCYSDFLPAKNCDVKKKSQTDLTDDGNVNSQDLNLFIREMSIK